MLLYKYRNCAQRTWELLLNRKLFFATPEQLNDPLDSSIDIQSEYERAKKLVHDSDDHPERRKSFLIFLLDGYHRFNDPTTGKQTRICFSIYAGTSSAVRAGGKPALGPKRAPENEAVAPVVHQGIRRQGRRPVRDGACAVPRSAGWVARARSALREPTRGICLNGARQARAVSYAAWPLTRASQGTPRAARGAAVKPPRTGRLP